MKKHKKNKINDILSDEMRRVFKECESEGLSRVKIYLEVFNNPDKKLQAKFTREDIPLIKVWVDGQKDKQRKREKFEERMWNLGFLLMGAGISAVVIWGTTRAQLDIMRQQHADTMKRQEIYELRQEEIKDK